MIQLNGGNHVTFSAPNIAASVLDAVGGIANVVANSTCMTRLRITVADSSLIDAAALDALESVLGCVERGVNGIEVVFGPRTIGPVYEEFAQLTGLEAGVEPLIGSRRPSKRMNVHISASTPKESTSEVMPERETAAEHDTSDDDERLLNNLSELLDEA